MNKVLRAATVLTWVNMIIWSLFCLFFLLAILSTGVTALLLALILPSAIVLHSYAAFQLQKSIRNPAVPLSSQTPTGIRFIGFVALFIGISTLAQSLSILQHSAEIAKTVQAQLADQLKSQVVPQLKNFIFKEVYVRAIGIITLLMGLCVVINVNLNFRLLRWYYFLRDNKDK